MEQNSKVSLINLLMKHIWSDPCTPQQNGKIGRFWQGAETCYSKQDLAGWIQAINRQTHFTLNEAFSKNLIWNSIIEPERIVDGKRKPLVI